jgi:hypothetical protein
MIHFPIEIDYQSEMQTNLPKIQVKSKSVTERN